MENKKWEVIEHSWSDTSIYDEAKNVICTKSIYDECTEETQEEVENEVSKNFKLIACAPEMLEVLQNIVKEYDLDIVKGIDVRKIKELISKATTL